MLVGNFDLNQRLVLDAAIFVLLLVLTLPYWLDFASFKVRRLLDDLKCPLAILFDNFLVIILFATITVDLKSHIDGV